ncbi:MAG: MepB family protein [Mucilaginibacter sp.]|uniref:MepB family protein n=1 Tax=Mucilaginibacter sp. TaxID=1882438 RepID=UPI003267CD40
MILRKLDHDLRRSDLAEAKELVYDVLGYDCADLLMETESVEYGACIFKLNGLSVKFRVAKITPTKTGQFVTIWKREQGGPIKPFDESDEIDLIIISTRKENYFGQFIFPKAVLLRHGIISNKHVGGKRGIRVYPPWDVTTSAQAKKTQQWQLKYFLEIPFDKPLNEGIVRKLLG